MNEATGDANTRSLFRTHGTHGIAHDVRSAEELRRLTDSAIQRFGAIDVLVCNAGVSGPVGSMADVDDAVYTNTFDVNLRHAFILCGHIAPLMAKRGEGSIIVTSSIAGLRGNARIGLSRQWFHDRPNLGRRRWNVDIRRQLIK